MFITIKKDDKKIVDFVKTGKYNYAFFEDGSKIPSSKLGKIKIECYKCQKENEINFRNCLLKSKYVCQSCNKLGENNPFYGKKHTDEFIEKMKSERKNWYHGENNPFYGKKHSEETKEKIRNSLPDMKGENNPFFGKTHTVDVRNRQSEFMKNNLDRWDFSKMGVLSANKRPKKTKPEKITEQKLKELGIKFKYNFILHGKAQYDFLINDNIILEVHGDYWHGNPEFYEVLNDRQKYKQSRDLEKKKFANENGYVYYYIWENDIKNDNWRILDEISNDRN